MARFSRLEVLGRMLEVGVVPIFHHEDLEVARQIVSACSAGGATVVEFANRGELAHEVFGDLAARITEEAPGVILGAGAVADGAAAGLYMANGANFVAGSLFNPEVARLCNRRKVPYLPVCEDLRDLAEAEELGVEICQLGPGGELGSPAALKAALAPRPWTRAMPSGDLAATEESVSGWVEAGAACLGLGSDLVRPELVASGDFAAISARVASAISWSRKARGKSPFGPIEHVGVYVREGSSVEAIAEWYHRAFGYQVVTAREGYFVGNEIFGRIEAMNAPVGEACHIAVRVWDFEAAVEWLQAHGFELKEPRIGAASKLVYLKDRDPGGNLVHIVWRP